MSIGQHQDKISNHENSALNNNNRQGSAANNNGAGRKGFSLRYYTVNVRGSNKGKKSSDKVEGYRALFCLQEKNVIRRFAKLIAESKVFDYFILITIMFNCVILAIDAPLPENDMSRVNKIATEIEYFLLGIFCFEAVIKITAMGFVLHPRSYLRSGWNVLDFTVVVAGILTLPNVTGTKNLNIKALRAVRVLRPLKLISGIPSLQVVMTSVVRAMFPLLQVLFLVVFVIIIYAIIGLEFLNGRFHYSCYNKDTNAWEENQKPCDPNVGKVYRFMYGRRCSANFTCQRYWAGPNDGITSYDNIFLSMLTVFQCITMEGWTDIMYYTFYAIDTSGYVYSVYYVSLIVIGSFFMLNLVLGVLSGEFAKEREKVEHRREFIKLRQEQQIERTCDGYLEWVLKGEELLLKENDGKESLTTAAQEAREDLGAIILNPAVVFNTARYRLNANNHRKRKFDRLRRCIKLSRIKVRTMVKHHLFYWTVVCMVFLNTVILGSKNHGQPEWLTTFQDTSELVFVSIFAAEMLLKMYGLGVKAYFHSMFNIFDFVVVILSTLEVIMQSFSDDLNLGLSVMRSLRLLRVFKVTKYWSSLRNLVTSLMNGMKSILSLMFLLFLFIVISALLGMQLFGGKFAKYATFPRTNFDTFSDAMLAVFQIMTGEDWNAVMYNGVQAYGGPKDPWGMLVSLYFVFLVIFGNYTLLNVFLAIAVDNLTNAQILSQDEEMEKEKHDRNKRKRSARLGLEKKGDHWSKSKALAFVQSLQEQVELNEKNSQNAAEAEDPDKLSVDHTPALSPGSKGPSPQPSPQSAKSLKFPKSPKLPHSPLFGRLKSPIHMNGMAGESYENGYHEVMKKWERIVKSGNSEVLENKNASVDDITIEEHPQENGTANGKQENGAKEDDEVVKEQIKDYGLLNTLKANIALRRRINKTAIIRKSSLFIFGAENPIRKVCHRIVTYRHFDTFIMGVILISSLTLALENPVVDDAEINQVMLYFDYVFTIIFGIEVVLKIVDRGLILHKGSYFRDLWNVLDAFVVACNVASLIVSYQEGSKNKRASQTVKALRVLRVLRPLKAIHKVKKLKAVFQCMVYSLKNVTFVLIITVLFLFIFACIGVQLFKGKFRYCTDASKMTKEECHGKFYYFPSTESVIDNRPTVKPREWKLYHFHFDNIFEAMLTLFISSTGEGWPSSMHHTIDATSEGQGPIRNNKPHMALYYILFVIVFTFMIINIYVALIILTFQRQGEKEISDEGLERNERDCIHFAIGAKPRQRYMPTDKHSFSYRVWFVVDSKPFEYFIMLLIVLNTMQLMMQYDGSSETYDNILQALNITFTVLFLIEAALKITAYHLNYFKDLWNLFDLAVIVGSVLDVFLTSFAKHIEFMDPSMFRLCRAARIIKLLRKGTSIRLMLWTFLQSFKALPYVTTLILLLFYMYAVIGMQLFGKIAIDSTGERAITDYNNFRTIIQALQVLFRSATGEGWNTIMRDCYSDAPCDPDGKTTKCGNKFAAVIYFCSFIFLCMFLMLNLFVAVIMDNFEYLTRDSSILGPHHLDEFVRCWSEFDPTASGRIPHKLLYRMMCAMSPPVGFGKKCPKAIAFKRLIKMNMPVNGDHTVSFHPTLFALIRTAFEIKMKGSMFDNDIELRRIIKAIWPKVTEKSLDKVLPKPGVFSSQQMTVGKIYCVKLLVMNYRLSKEKKRQESMENEESPSVFKRIITTFRRSMRRSSTSREDEEMELRSGDYSYPQPRLRRYQTFTEGRKRSSSQTTGGEPSQQGQIAREERRRSSWHDLGSFFRISSKDGATPGGPEGAAAIEGVEKPQTSKTTASQETPNAPGVIHNRNTASRSVSGSGPGKSSLGRTASAGSADTRMRQSGSQSRGVDVNSLRNGQPRYNSSRNGPARSSTSRTIAGSAPSSLSLPGGVSSRTATSAVIDSKSPVGGSAFSRVQSSSQVGAHHGNQTGLGSLGGISHGSHPSLSASQSASSHGYVNSPKLGSVGHSSHSALGGHSQSNSVHSGLNSHGSGSAGSHGIPHVATSVSNHVSSSVHGSTGNRGSSSGGSHSSISLGVTHGSSHGMTTTGTRTTAHAQSSPNLTHNAQGSVSHQPIGHPSSSGNVSHPQAGSHQNFSSNNPSMVSGISQYSASGNYGSSSNPSLPNTVGHSMASSSHSLGGYSAHQPSVGVSGYSGITSSSLPTVCGPHGQSGYSGGSVISNFNSPLGLGSHSSVNTTTPNTTVTVIGTTPQSMSYTHATQYGPSLQSGQGQVYSSTSSLPAHSITSQGVSSSSQPSPSISSIGGQRYTPPRAGGFENSPIDQRYLDRTRPGTGSIRSTSSTQSNAGNMDPRFENQREATRPNRGNYGEDEMEILNGRQTQQYYDHMIAQINEQIARAVDRGQSPYAIYAMDEDEENDWC